MKISNSYEQGVYVIILLALEKDHKPLKSRVMSEVLQVSDSYLKKILMKLSRSGLVQASASKQGGYTLNKDVTEISLKDVYTALDLDDHSFTSSHYSEVLFPHREHAKESEKKIEETVLRGFDSFLNELDKLKISDLLEDGAYQNGAIAWEDRIENA